MIWVVIGPLGTGDVRIKVEVRRPRLEWQREPGPPVVTLIDIVEILE